MAIWSGLRDMKKLCTARIASSKLSGARTWSLIHLGKRRRTAGFAKRPGGPAGGQDLHAGANKGLSQFEEAGLIGNGEQRAGDFHTVRGGHERSAPVIQRQGAGP